MAARDDLGGDVDRSDVKDELRSYLRGASEALVWKLDGLNEYEIRRPMTPTGTNLLGLIKHSTATHFGYFGEVFGRPSTDIAGELTWDATQFWARPDESREEIVGRYRAAWAFADATVSELSLESTGRVWWWGDAEVTLHRILIHVIADTQRHAGHADILRELIDGSVGMLAGADNLHVREASQRRRLHDQIAEAAATFEQPQRDDLA